MSSSGDKRFLKRLNATEISADDLWFAAEVFVDRDPEDRHLEGLIFELCQRFPEEADMDKVLAVSFRMTALARVLSSPGGNRCSVHQAP